MSNTQIVYRIQNDRGRGAYQGTGSEWQTSTHDWGTNRATPAPNKSFGASQWYAVSSRATPVAFGFTSMAQLRRWFNKTERKRLVKLGYKVWRYSVPRLVLYSPDQCCFLASHRVMK